MLLLLFVAVFDLTGKSFLRKTGLVECEQFLRFMKRREMQSWGKASVVHFNLAIEVALLSGSLVLVLYS